MEFGLGHSVAADIACLVADHWSWTAVLAMSAVRCDGSWPTIRTHTRCLVWSMEVAGHWRLATASVANTTVGVEDTGWPVNHLADAEVARGDLDHRARTAVSA